MALVRKIAFNVIFNSALKVVSTVFIALLSIRLTTGYLGQAGFGEYATVLAFFAFFGALGDLGLAALTTREISKPKADEARILGNVVALRLVVSVALALVAPPLVYVLHYTNHVKAGIVLIVVALGFAQLGTLLNGIYQKRVKMDRVALIEFVGKLIQLLVVYIAVKFDLGFLFIVSAHLVTMSFNALASFFLSRRLITFRLQWDRDFWRAFLTESLPLGLTTLITFAYFKTDTIILSFLQPSSEVGIYNVAYKIIENLLFFPAMLVGLILPLLAHSLHQNRERFVHIANKTAKVFLLLALPLVIGTSFFAPTIVSLVSGPGFEASANVLRFLIFSLAFMFFGNYFNMLLLVANAQKRLMRTLFFVAVFNMALNVVLVRGYSYLGAAFTSALTEFLVVVVTGWLTYQTLNYIPRPGRILGIAAAGALMAATLFLTRDWPFLFAGSIGVLAYGGGLWIAKVISQEEILSLFAAKEASEELLMNV